jgi:hypothetical protein
MIGIELFEVVAIGYPEPVAAVFAGVFNFIAAQAEAIERIMPIVSDTPK